MKLLSETKDGKAIVELEAKELLFLQRCLRREFVIDGGAEGGQIRGLVVAAEKALEQAKRLDKQWTESLEGKLWP